MLVPSWLDAAPPVVLRESSTVSFKVMDGYLCSRSSLSFQPSKQKAEHIPLHLLPAYLRPFSFYQL
jgi:hypothetical protein